MSDTPRTDRHTIEINADASVVFQRLTDVSRWSEMFEPTIHGCEISRTGGVQSVQLWATANGEPKTWISDRTVDENVRTIRFTQTATAPPVAEMSGEWRVDAHQTGQCSVELLHTYRAENDRDESLSWIAQAVDTNSLKELTALKATCERSESGGYAPFTFSDHVLTNADPELVFTFLDRGDLWAERLDHVSEAEMAEFPGGLQRLRMSTHTPDRDAHITESVRVSQPPAVLFYKQTTLPELLSLHTGRWTITPAGEQWRVTSQHTIAIREGAVTRVLGPEATADDACALARRNLGNNSRQTLQAACRWAADSVPAL